MTQRQVEKNITHLAVELDDYCTKDFAWNTHVQKKLKALERRIRVLEGE
jgi:hypothetical protein